MPRQSRIAKEENPVVSSTQLARVFNRVTAGRAPNVRLYAAIDQYVDFLRDAGLPPEKVLIAVKRGLGFDELGHQAPNPLYASVVNRAITECICRYFGDSPPVSRAH